VWAPSAAVAAASPKRTANGRAAAATREARIESAAVTAADARATELDRAGVASASRPDLAAAADHESRAARR
jgi:hypothetical protein